MSEGERPDQPPRSGLLRRLRRAVAALVLVAFAVVLLLHLPPVQRSLIDLGIRRLSSPIGADIAYREVGFNLITGRITLVGFSLSPHGGRPLVAAERLDVRFPWELFRGHLDNLDVTLETAQVHLVQEHGKWTSIPARWLQPSATPGHPRPLPPFAAIRLHHVNVRYEDVDAHFIADTSDLSVDLLPAKDGPAGDLSGQITPGATTKIYWQPRAATLRIMGGRARFSPQATGIDNLKLRAAEGDVSTDVRFAFRGENRFRLKTTGTLRGDTLSAWLPLLETLRGPLNVEFAMPAIGGAPAFADVKVAATDLAWRNVAVRELTAQGALDIAGITLNSTMVRVGAGTAEGHGRLAWAAAGESHASTSWRDMDAGNLWRTLLAGSAGALYVAPGSLVSGRFEGRWASWHAADLKGRLQSTWRRRPAGLARAEHLWLDGRIDAEFAGGPWHIAVDAIADGALGMVGRVETRGSRGNYADWPLGGQLALSGSTPPVLRDGFRLVGFNFDPQLQDASGELTGQATLSRTFGTVLSDLTIDSTLAWPDQPTVRMALRASVDPDGLSVDEWRASSGPSQATATALLDFNRHTVDGTFSGQQVAVEAWTRRFGLGRPATGLVDVVGHIRGPLKAPTIDAQVHGGPVETAGQVFDTVAARVTFGDGVLQLDEGQLIAREGGELAVHGSWSTKTDAIDGTATARALRLAARSPEMPPANLPSAGMLSAAVDGEAHVSGTARSPIVAADFRTDALTLGDRVLGPVQANVTTSLGSAHVVARAKDLGAALDGVLELAGERHFTADASVHTADSPIAQRLHGVDIDVGAMDLTAHAAGTLTTPTVSTAGVSIGRLDAIVGGLPLQVAPGARVAWQPGRLAVAGLTVSTGNTRLKADGEIDGSAAHQLVLSLDGRLEDFRPAVVQFLPAGYETVILSGPISAGLTASGALDRLTVAGNFLIVDAEAGDGVHPPATGVQVRASLDSTQLRLDLAEGHWQSAHVAVAGTVPSWFLGVPGAAQRGAAALTGHVDNVTIKVLEPFVEGDALKATDFNLRAEYTVTADAPTFDALSADVRITNATLKSRELGVSQQSPGHLALRRRVLTLDPWAIGAPWSTTTRVTIGGSIHLTDAPTISAKVDGRLDLRALGLLLGTYRPAGTAVVNAAIDGPLTNPSVDGNATVKNAELLIRDPRLVFSGINGTIRFTGDQIALDAVRGSVNGGSLEAGGSMRRPGRGQATGALTATVRGALFDAPRGFRSMVDADLRLAGRPQDSRLVLSGTATIIEAAYRQSLIVTGGLLSLFQPKETPVVAPTQRSGPPILTLDLRILADDSIAIDTSYGQVAVGTNLRVLGPPSNVRLIGQADIAPGGRLYFGGHTYQIESGRLEFRDPTSIVPSVHLLAQTNIAGYSITMRIETIEGRVETTLNSDPPLPDDQIASLMISGQRTSTTSAGDLVTQQLAAALSGEITSAVGRAIGFDSVRVESGNPGDVMFDPTLISADSNPTQRLTFTKRILPTLNVIVSQNLRESGQITWIVGWEPVPRFELRFVELDDQDRSYEIRHDVSFGGGVATRVATPRIPETVRDVFVAAFGDVTEDEIRARLRITEGRRFDFYKWQQDRDHLQELFIERGYYEARITARRDPPTPPQKPTSSTPVDLGYTIESGPRTALVVNGVQLPDSLRTSLVQAWVDTPIDALLGEEFEPLLRPWLAKDGYLRPSISTRIDTGVDTKSAVITVAPGTRTTDRRVLYSGNTTVTSKDLDAALAAAQLQDRMWSAPGDVQTVLVSTYHDLGYLGAKVTVGEPRFIDSRAELPVTILEGGVYHVGTVRVVDANPSPAAGVDLTPPVAEGATLTDALIAQGARQLQQRYRLAGYRATRVTADSTPRQNPTTVDLVFRVARGPRLTFGTLTIQGAEGPERALIEKLVAFAPGEPVSLDALGRARDRLYETDLFRSVTIDNTPRRAGEGQPAQPVIDATVTVELLPKYRLRYGFQLFDPYRPAVSPKWGSVDPGVVADLTRRGLFGRGLTAGISGRANPSDRVARGYLSSREFFGFSAQTNLYIGDEWQRTVEGPFSLEERRRDATLEQRLRFRRYGLQFSYGYNFQRLNQDLLVELPGIPVPVPFAVNANLSRLLLSLYVDRRDNAIDTRRGWFHSGSVDFAPEWLGSTAGYRKYLLQQFLFLPASARIVLGSAARFEVVSGGGQRFITTERLRAGGAYTVRGYDDITLAILADRQPTVGRTSLLVLNEELRFPLSRRFQAAAFWDHASFFGDVDLAGERRIRNSLGGGIRLVLPFILLRVDYGYPLNQDPVNDKGHWYFAIGQAF